MNEILWAVKNTRRLIYERESEWSRTLPLRAVHWKGEIFLTVLQVEIVTRHPK